MSSPPACTDVTAPTSFVPTPRPPVARELLRHGAQVLVANSAIALLIALIHGGGLVGALVYAQAIGLVSWAAIEFGRHALPGLDTARWPRGWRGLALAVAGCAIGYVGGTTIADAVFGQSTWHDYLARPHMMLQDVTLTAIFAALVVGWFWSRGRAAEQRAQVAATAHEATLARLVLLQSQLEPHMLFNTLANLRALIAADPPRAQAMLDRLIDFLRATLAASRVATHPLRDEFARVEDYLALMQVRMGERLRTRCELPAALAALPVPPLLLQPLVENAVKHGLEPQRGPGELVVRAALAGSALVLVVEDSGRGLAAAARDAGAPGGGFGVAQVRERLRTLYAQAGTLELAERTEGGTRATIRLPLPVTPSGDD